MKAKSAKRTVTLRRNAVYANMLTGWRSLQGANTQKFVVPHQCWMRASNSSIGIIIAAIDTKFVKIMGRIIVKLFERGFRYTAKIYLHKSANDPCVASSEVYIDENLGATGCTLQFS